MIVTSTCLIVTAGWLIPSTQAVSQGAGQSRPVNSGKLFVACRRSMASRQSPRQARSFHSGMRLPKGAAAVAERDSAVHAAAGLALELADLLRLVDLLPVLEADRNGTPLRAVRARGGEKAGRVSHGCLHDALPDLRCRRGRGRRLAPARTSRTRW
jgi:hypothetical protein